jgi:very-short-patch-repair endonuclease
MGVKTHHSRSVAAWALTRRQHGVVTRTDLLRLGFGSKAIQHRLATGRLHRVYQGVYAVGRSELTKEGRWQAALLACGTDAYLSHGSAAAFWGIEEERRGIEVVIVRDVMIRRPRLAVHRRPTLPHEDLMSHQSLPVTSPLRALLDLATYLSLKRLDRAVNEASSLDLVDPERLCRWLDLRSGEPGVRPLRALLDRDTFRLSDTELEVLFRPLALASGLSQPLTKVQVNGFEVDFFWPDLGLVVETDSLRFHRTASKQARDLLRDQTHVASGLTPLRFNHFQVKHEPAHVRAVLAATAHRLRAAR